MIVRKILWATFGFVFGFVVGPIVFARDFWTFPEEIDTPEFNE